MNCLPPLRCRTEEGLRGALDQLVDASLVFRRGAPPHASFVFKHALVQDAAYSTLLRDQRQELHARIARSIEQQFPELVEGEPEILAHHYTQAGLANQAISYLTRAGRRALDSIRHGRSGIAADEGASAHIGAAAEPGTRKT